MTVEATETSKDFQTLFMEGKKAFVMENFEDASKYLSEACEIANAKYGDFAPESFDVLFYYGRSLVEIARTEEDAVNLNATKAGESEAMDEEDDSEANEDGAEAKDGDAEAKDEAMEEDSEAKDVEPKTNGEEAEADADVAEAQAKIDEAEARMEEATAKVQGAKAKVEELKAGTEAKEDMAEAKDVEPKGNGEEAQAKIDEAVAMVNEAKVMVQVAKAKIDEAEAKAKEVGVKMSDAEEEEAEAKANGEEAKAEAMDDKAEAETEEKKSDAEEAEEKTDGEEGVEADEASADEAEDEDGPSNAMLAYEVLEVCRKICEKQVEKEADDAAWVAKKADVLIALCDCAVVDNRMDQAQLDIAEGIELLKTVSGVSARRLAEAHMYSARAFMAADEFAKAGQQYKEAQTALSTYRDGLTDEANEEAKKEREEIASLLSEVAERIEDAERSEEQYRVVKEEVSVKLDLPKSSDKPTTDAEVNDITSLVRKGVKRPAEKVDLEPGKKPKTADENEDPSAGDATVAESA